MTFEIIAGALKIFGALGFFLYGMKIMSEGLQQVAGSKMRQILSVMTTNRFTGLATGFLITAILQSSSATTVMTVSFVNAGIISLVESAGVMMGANIGTTITGWLVSLIGFKFKVANIALPAIAFGLPFIFSHKDHWKKWGEVIIGFALLFLGLEALKDAVPDLRENDVIIGWLQQFNHPGFLTRLLFVMVGTVLTVIMQSSSAAMTLTIALTLKGLPLDIAAAMVLGENIGTTITAELASLVANVHAKRSARIHSLFNIIGVTWMIILAPFFIQFINWIFPLEATGNANQFALAAFHTGFNLLNVIFLIGFVNVLVKMAIRTVKVKGEDDEDFALEYIQQGVFSSAPLNIEEARKEIITFSNIVEKMLAQLNEQYTSDSEKRRGKIHKKIKKGEDLTDELETQIAEFLAKVSMEKLSEISSRKIKSYLSIISDLERMADMIFRLSTDLKRKEQLKIAMNDVQSENILKLFEKLNKAFQVMKNNLFIEEITQIDEAIKLESEIDKTVKKYRKELFSNIDQTEYDVKAGIVYRDLYNGIERLGDYIINVNEAVLEIEPE